MKYGIGALSALAGVLAIVFAAGWASAHHSFTAVYDLSKKQTLTGTLTKVDWRNPHIEVDVDVKSEAGKTESWTVEGMPPSWFKTRKVEKADFEKSVGQTITVLGNRAKDGSLSVLMEKITLPGGISVEVPGLGPAPAATPAPPAAP